MKRSNQLVLESAVIASVLIALTLGGSIVTTTIPPSFASLQDPGTVKVNHDSSALAVYYNTTLAKIGARAFLNASFLLDTFHFVNISPAVNATAQLANSDLAVVNTTAANATRVFQLAALAIGAKEYVNATVLVDLGCSLAQQANRSLADFLGPQTNRFRSESIPVTQYSKGGAAASAEVKSLLDACSAFQKQLSFAGLVLLIGSPQTAIETGGTVKLEGNLTYRGTPVPREEVLFYIDGAYFGSLATGPGGDLAGTLRIPFIYAATATVQALVLPNATLALGGASSNSLLFQILFNQTSIVVGDPPAVLPTYGFSVEGNLSTVSGTALPDAPVKITFMSESQLVRTDIRGVFATRLTVPANATDGVYNVYASFAPQGTFGPSFNFTSVMVVHLPMVLRVNAPDVSFPGFSTTLTGSASSNGTALSGANITVNSPWGSFSARTNSSGGFRVALPISPFEFAFSRGVTVGAVAPQPYVAPGSLAESLGLFNILLVILPVAAVGIIGYEADRLGAFRSLRRKGGSRGGGAAEVAIEPGVTEVEPTAATAGPELLRAYRRALEAAARGLSLRFRRSQTVREMSAMVGSRDPGEGGRLFGEVMLAVEDFLYSEDFDPSRLSPVEERVRRLEEMWR